MKRESSLQKLFYANSLESSGNDRDHYWEDIAVAIGTAKDFCGFEPINSEIMRVNTKEILKYLNNQLVKPEQKDNLIFQLQHIIQLIVQAFAVDCGMNPAAKTEQDSVFLNICIRLNKILMEQGYGNEIAVAIDLWYTINPLLLRQSNIKTR